VVRLCRILALVFLSLTLISSPVLAGERLRINARADVEDENVGIEFEYNLSYRVYIDGGLGLNILGPINKGRVSLGFKYYLIDPDDKFYLRIRGITNFEDATITRFRLGFGIGYTTYFNHTRSSLEVGILVGSYSGTLEIKPSLGISVTIR